METIEKPCLKCHKSQPIEQFGYSARYKDKKFQRCKTCINQHQTEYRRNHPKKHDPVKSRQVKLKYRYGLTFEAHAQMYANQDGKCAACGNAARLVIDHDHITGRVRGLLCNLCNYGIGQFRDDPIALDLAAAYLRKWYAVLSMPISKQ